MTILRCLWIIPLLVAVAAAQTDTKPRIRESPAKGRVSEDPLVNPDSTTRLRISDRQTQTDKHKDPLCAQRPGGPKAISYQSVPHMARFTSVDLTKSIGFDEDRDLLTLSARQSAELFFVSGE